MGSSGNHIWPWSGNISSGMNVVRDLQRRYINEYMARMQWAGIDKTLDNLGPGLAAYIDQEATQQSGVSG